MKPEFKVKKIENIAKGVVKVRVGITFSSKTLHSIAREYNGVVYSWGITGLIGSFVKALLNSGDLCRDEAYEFFGNKNLVLKEFEFIVSEHAFKKLKNCMKREAKNLKSRQNMKNAFAKYVDDKLKLKLL